ncbi:hypothetical protein [Hymenobacter rubidus]|uniref:hypothetical protein n=1 Tax=Hymenobacter rubidus TaxID=1441626 RepID=UPI001920244B|nr:hypothetical protein [Hymenobacter rubidus]
MKTLLKLASAVALSCTFLAAHAQEVDGKMAKKEVKGDGKMMKHDGKMMHDKMAKKDGKMMKHDGKMMKDDKMKDKM